MHSLLLFSDLHLDLWPALCRGRSRLARLKELSAILSQIAELVSTYNADVAFLGDMFHARDTLAAPVVRAFYRGMVAITQAMLGTNHSIYLIGGNHDDGRAVGVSSLTCLKPPLIGKPVVVVSDSVLTEEIGGKKVLLVPYMGRTDKFLRHSSAELLLGHFGVRGSMEWEADDEVPIAVLQQINSIYLGHYHRRRSVPVEYKKKIKTINYIGSAVSHSWEDTDKHGCTLLQWVNPKAPITEKFIKLQSPEIRSLTVQTESELQRYKPVPRPHYLRVNTNQELASAVRRQIPLWLEAGACHVDVHLVMTKQLTEVQPKASRQHFAFSVKKEMRRIVHGEQDASSLLRMGMELLDENK